MQELATTLEGIGQFVEQLLTVDQVKDMATNSCTPNDSETESYLSATSSEDEALEDVVENMEKVKLKLQGSLGELPDITYDGPRIIVDVSDHEDDNEYAVFNDVDTDDDIIMLTPNSTIS